MHVICENCGRDPTTTHRPCADESLFRQIATPRMPRRPVRASGVVTCRGGSYRARFTEQSRAWCPLMRPLGMARRRRPRHRPRRVGPGDCPRQRRRRPEKRRCLYTSPPGRAPPASAGKMPAVWMAAALLMLTVPAVQRPAALSLRLCVAHQAPPRRRARRRRQPRGGGWRARRHPAGLAARALLPRAAPRSRRPPLAPRQRPAAASERGRQLLQTPAQKCRPLRRLTASRGGGQVDA